MPDQTLVPVDYNPFALSDAMTHAEGQSADQEGLFERVYQNHGLPRAIRMAAAIPQALWDVLGRPIESALTLPRDVAEGRVDPLSPEGIQRAGQMAGVLAGGGMPMAEEDALGIFGGIGARAMPPTKEANALLESGASRDEIYNRTGWFWGPDSKWRFEIGDQGSRLTPEKATDLMFDGQPIVVGDMLQHRDLYRQYPDLKDMPLHLVPGLRQGMGFYDPETRSITIDPLMSEENIHKVLLHELQHAIQDKEGFAFGTNPKSALVRPYVQDQVSVVRDLRDRVNRAGDLLEQAAEKRTGNHSLSAIQDVLKENPDIKAGLQRLSLRYNDAQAALAQAQHEVYSRFAGEAESRNVESRLDPQTLGRPPWMTMDVPEANQIVSAPRGGQPSGR